MKVYELMELLSQFPSGKDIIISCGEKSFIPYELDDSDTGDMKLAVVIFAKLDK